MSLGQLPAVEKRNYEDPPKKDEQLINLRKENKEKKKKQSDRTQNHQG